MTDKTAKQIENMKLQTIGVEIECNNIERSRCAKIAAEYFGTGRYEYTARRNGYMTWSAWDADGREWKFQRDVSISGPDEEKCEIVSPVLTYDDMDLLQGLVRRVRKAGARSSASRGCGVHIHIGRGDHTPQSLRNLANMMAAHEDQLAEAVRMDRWRQSRYCRTVDPRFIERLNKEKPKTFEALANVWYEANGASYGRSQHYNDSRYHMLNYHATFTKGTIEFRLFQFDEAGDGKRGGLHAGQLKAMIQLCLAMSELAKELRTASPKKPQTENTAYAFRTWMLRLGFIGDEFKTARDYYMRNTEGSCAWRYGRP